MSTFTFHSEAKNVLSIPILDFRRVEAVPIVESDSNRPQGDSGGWG